MGVFSIVLELSQSNKFQLTRLSPLEKSWSRYPQIKHYTHSPDQPKDVNCIIVVVLHEEILKTGLGK